MFSKYLKVLFAFVLCASLLLPGISYANNGPPPREQERHDQKDRGRNDGRHDKQQGRHDKQQGHHDKQQGRHDKGHDKDKRGGHNDRDHNDKGHKDEKRPPR